MSDYRAQYNARSHTEDKTYKISQTWDGKWQCSCPAWTFQRGFLHEGETIDREALWCPECGTMLEWIEYGTKGKTRPECPNADCDFPDHNCKHIVELLNTRDIDRDIIEFRETRQRIECVLTGRVLGMIDDL